MYCKRSPIQLRQSNNSYFRNAKCFSNIPWFQLLCTIEKINKIKPNQSFISTGPSAGWKEIWYSISNTVYKRAKINTRIKYPNSFLTSWVYIRIPSWWKRLLDTFMTFLSKCRGVYCSQRKKSCWNFCILDN